MPSQSDDSTAVLLLFRPQALVFYMLKFDQGQIRILKAQLCLRSSYFEDLHDAKERLQIPRTQFNVWRVWCPWLAVLLSRDISILFMWTVFVHFGVCVLRIYLDTLRATFLFQFFIGPSYSLARPVCGHPKRKYWVMGWLWVNVCVWASPFCLLRVFWLH